MKLIRRIMARLVRGEVSVVKAFHVRAFRKQLDQCIAAPVVLSSVFAEQDKTIAAIVAGIEIMAHSQTLFIVDAGNAPCLLPGLCQRWQQHGCQYCDDCDYNEQFDQSKGLFHSCLQFCLGLYITFCKFSLLPIVTKIWWHCNRQFCFFHNLQHISHSPQSTVICKDRTFFVFA